MNEPSEIYRLQLMFRGHAYVLVGADNVHDPVHARNVFRLAELKKHRVGNAISFRVEKMPEDAILRIPTMPPTYSDLIAPTIPS